MTEYNTEIHFHSIIIILKKKSILIFEDFEQKMISLKLDAVTKLLLETLSK